LIFSRAQTIVSSPEYPPSFLGPTQLPDWWVVGALSLEIKWPEQEGGQSPLSSAKVEIVWSTVSTCPNTFMKGAGTALSVFMKGHHLTPL